MAERLPRGWTGRRRSGLGDGLHAADAGVADALWVSRGINGVPAVVVKGKWLISGGQPAGVFKEALQGMAAGPA